MRNFFIILLWALLLACGIFAYAVYKHSVQADQALEASQSELSALQSESFGLKQKLTQATGTISRLESSAQQLAADLQSSKEAQGQSVAELESLQEEIKLLNGALADKDKELAAIEEQYSQKTAVSAETLSQKSRLFSDLQKAHKGLAAQVDEAGAAIKNLQAKEKSMQAQLTAEKEARLNARAALDEINKSETYLQAQLAEALRNRNKVEADYQNLRQELAASQQKMDGLRAQLSEKTALLAKLSSEKDSVLNQAERIKTTYEALVSGLRVDIDKKQATIEAFEDKVRVRFVDRVLFKSGHSSVTAKGRASLKKVADALVNMPGYTVRVSGHTDNVPISEDYQAKFPTNWELSAARAAAVVRYFVEELGWDGSRMQAVGHGDYQPVASNETVEGRAQNRRVEIAVIPN